MGLLTGCFFSLGVAALPFPVVSIYNRVGQMNELNQPARQNLTLKYVWCSCLTPLVL